MLRKTPRQCLIYVVRKEGAVLLTMWEVCWQRDPFSLPWRTEVTFVDETMKNLEVRFDPGGYNYQSCYCAGDKQAGYDS